MNSQAAVEMLPIIAEVSVALAASTGIILAFTRDPEDWEAFDSIRILMLLTTSLTMTVLALLPFVLFAAEVPERAVWRVSSALLVIVYFVQGALMNRRIRAMEPSERENFRPWIAGSVVAGGGLSTLAQALNAAGIFFDGAPAVVLAGQLWGVVVCCVVFVLLIFLRPRSAA